MSGNRGSFKVDWTDSQQLRKLVTESLSRSEVLRKMKLVPSSNVRTFNKYIALYNIDISHFDAQKSRLRTRKQFCTTPLSDILIENSNRVDRYGLKQRLVNEGVLKYICTKCGNVGEWQGEKLTLHLEHKNGINNDNRLENLEFLCPNCHSQTSTYAGRNKCTNK